ncbi:MAG: hypothetical protein AAB975_03290, partial [Patescibacteria group bacterium]
FGDFYFIRAFEVAAVIFGISFFIVLRGGSNNSLSDLRVYRYDDVSKGSMPQPDGYPTLIPK